MPRSMHCCDRGRRVLARAGWGWRRRATPTLKLFARRRECGGATPQSRRVVGGGGARAGGDSDTSLTMSRMRVSSPQEVPSTPQARARLRPWRPEWRRAAGNDGRCGSTATAVATDCLEGRHLGLLGAVDSLLLAHIRRAHAAAFLLWRADSSACHTPICACSISNQSGRASRAVP